MRLWWDALGAEETRALLAADNAPAELALRVNPLVDFDLSDIPGARDGDTIVVDGPFDALAHPGYAAGAFTPQSRASQLVAPVLGPRPGERVLDLCAAPGGKTTHLAALMGDEGEVVAVERHRGRARALQAMAQRMRALERARRRRRRQAFVDPAASIACCSTRLAAASGRCARTPTCAGASTPRDRAPGRRAGRAAGRRPPRAAPRRHARVLGLHHLPGRGAPPRRADAVRTFPHKDGTDGFYIARDGG